MGKESDIVGFMHQINKLKTIERAGWVRRGIESSESVSDHSNGITILALILTPKTGIDSSKVLKMSIIHDWAESKIGDIIPADGVSKEEKYKLEESAMTELIGYLNDGSELLSLWKEFEVGETNEAKFVKNLDKLEMMFQAHEYGISQPRVNLNDFWEYAEKIDFGEVQLIYNQLRNLR